MPIATPQTCNWCGGGFTGSDCLSKPCPDCRNRYQIKCLGVARDGENRKALSVMFDREPTNGEVRAIHDYMRMVGMIIETPSKWELSDNKNEGQGDDR